MPTQTIGGGRATVTVKQTAKQAILNWQTFNVGRNTTLAFDQSAGGVAANTWVALNKVNDLFANPTQILGKITAPGQVYIINSNGVIFGATAQVSVGSLLAATAGFSGGDSAFLTRGIYSALSKGGSVASLAPAFTGATGSIEIDAGAQLTTGAPAGPLNSGGYVLMLGKVVVNAGAIDTPGGQALLAAGTDFVVTPGFDVNAAGAGNTTSTVRGNAIAVVNGGSVTNYGIITATTGDVSLVGRNVTQGGVIVSTTSATQRGTVHLLTPIATETNRTTYAVDGQSSVTLAPGSTTAITLDPNSGTALDAQRAGNIASSGTNDALRLIQSITLNDQTLLSDRQDESRIELTAGGLVNIQKGALAVATGGQIAVSVGAAPLTTGRPQTLFPSTATLDPASAKLGNIFLAGGATIDVSGSTATLLPVSANNVTVNVQGFELRDAPANRDTGALSSQNVYLDRRQLIPLAPSAGYPTTRLYTAGGLLEVSGYVANIGHSIGEWTTPGGTVTLSAQQVVAQPGAVVNLAGGALAYSAGYVRQSWLIGSDGRLYNANTAPANVTYTGVFSGFPEQHSRWGITNVFDNPLVAPTQVFDPGYTVGRDAGRLLLSAPTAAFEGFIDAGVIAGERQNVARNSAITDPYLQAQMAVPQHGSLALGDYSFGVSLFDSNVTISDRVMPIAAGLEPGGRLPRDVANTVNFNASSLGSFGLGGLQVQVGATLTGGIGTVGATKQGTITVADPLKLAPGGTVTLAGAVVVLDSPITARSGMVVATSQASLVVLQTVAGQNVVGAKTFNIAPRKNTRNSVGLAAASTIDTRGLWTNALGGGDLSGAGLVNGGAVTLNSNGTLSLGAGSLVDASAGAALLPGGKPVSGNGGNITLISDGAFQQTKAGSKPSPVTFGGTVRSVGVGKGGTFTLEVPEVAIGDRLLPLTASQVVLSPSFFASGFSGYTIDAFGTVNAKPTAYSLTVASGTQLAVTEPLYQFTPQSSLTPTGGDPASALQFSLLPEYLLNPVRASVTQRPGASLALEAIVPASQVVAGGGIDIGAGALLQVDTKQSIRIEAFNQITVEGSLRAPSGSIFVLNDRSQPPSPGKLDQYVRGLSVWIGDATTLDVAGQPVVALDRAGRSFGTITAGGIIVLGANYVQSPTLSTQAAVILRPGSVLEASGASAPLDPSAGTAAIGPIAATVTFAGSDAGTVALSSYVGIFADGNISAHGGLGGARGGALDVSLITPLYSLATVGDPITFSQDARRVHELTIGQFAKPLNIAADTVPGSPNTFSGNLARLNTAYLSTSQIAGSGFTRLSLTSSDAMVFDGNTTLAGGESIRLAASTFSDTSLTGVVLIQAPYLSFASPVILSGAANPVYFGITPGGVQAEPGASITPYSRVAPCFGGTAGCSSAVFTVSANLIDVRGAVNFGAFGTIDLSITGKPVSVRRVSLIGFADVNLSSAGDIRFISGAVSSSGDITLAAAQVYATTPATAGSGGKVAAGVEPVFAAGSPIASTFSVYPKSVLSIERTTSAIPQAPLSAFGSLLLSAATVEQGGILRAPLGNITLGSATSGANSAQTSVVEFLPGSITSVSADGLTIPFGGTTNGITYSYGSTPVRQDGVVGVVPAFGTTSNGLGGYISNTGVTLTAQSVLLASGATIDISGGGTLAGGGGEYVSNGTFVSQGFISGRTGSTDTLYTPLVTFAGGAANAPALQSPTNASPTAVGVYAIVPSFGSAYAPTTGFDEAATYAGSVPTPGQQITITTPTAGLPAGTYTLLPSYYALLPGGYRVEFGNTPRAATGATGPLGNGSAVGAGYVGIANAGVQASLPVSVTVTPGTVARTYSQYDEQTYSQYFVGIANQFGNARPSLPQDAKTLALLYPNPSVASKQMLAATKNLPALIDNGTLLAAPGPDGYADTVVVSAGGGSLEITPGLTPTPGFKGVSVGASQIDALGGALLRLGSLTVDVVDAEVLVRAGATLAAAEIDIPTSTQTNSPAHIVIEPGATLTTLGRGPAPPVPSRQEYPSVGNGLFLSNSVLSFAPSAGITSDIGVGVCLKVSDCGLGTASLLSDGAIVLAGKVTLGANIAFGAKSLTVAVPTIALTTRPALAVADTTPAFALTQEVLQTLLSGVPAQGIAPLQQLTLVATGSVDIFGAPTLSTINPATGVSSLAQFVLQTPIINGLDPAGTTSTITTGNFVFAGGPTVNSVNSTPISYVATGNGHGTLDIIASNIVFGYPAATNTGTTSLAASNSPVGRTIGGFAAVNLIASQSISSTNNGSLTVYESPGTYTNAGGFAGRGGNLTLTTPLITGGPGSVLHITASGALVLNTPAGVAPSLAATGAQGAELDFTAPSITDTTTILLPAGRLAVTASAGDITLGSLSRTVLTGQATTFFDQVRYSPGGEVVLESATGNVTQAADALIDVSAAGAAAGSLAVTATGGTLGAAGGGGTVALLGALLGAGGPGFAGGSVDVRAAVLPQAGFVDLNTRLNAGGFLGRRAFDVATGSLALGVDGSGGAVLRGSDIEISVDGGSLLVTGLVDASGPAPGVIRLAASGGLTIDSTATLDAHGTKPQLDQTGASIDARNAGSIELAVSGGSNGANTITGTLVVNPGAVLDVSAAPGITCALGACGKVEFSAARTGATSGDIAINVPGPVTINGAGSIAVNAFWNYAPAGGIVVQTNLQTIDGVTTLIDPNKVGLDQTDAQSLAFIATAESGRKLIGPLAGKLAGLTAYTSTFHLRPGVEITSATPTGSLAISGDLDLSRYRYASLNPRTQPGSLYGSGEPGVLVLRAAGNLTVEGSINDGFGQAKPLQTPDDAGWVLLQSANGLTGTVVVPAGLATPVVLEKGTFFPSSATLNFELPVGPVGLPAFTPVPAVSAASPAVSLLNPSVLPAGFVTTGTIRIPGGATLPAGTRIGITTTLPAGTSLGAGATLPRTVRLSAFLWPAGVPLAPIAANGLLLSANLTLRPGDIIPVGTVPVVSKTAGVNLRQPGTSGAQGVLYGALPLLPTSSAADTLSWSLRLVAGANPTAADTRVIQAATQIPSIATAPGGSGTIALSDLHYSGLTAAGPLARQLTPEAAFSVVRTGTGYLDLIAAGNVQEDTLFGVYTAGAQTPGVLAAFNLPRQSYVAKGNAPAGTILGPLGATALPGGQSYETVAASTYAANYPRGGGDVLVRAQGDLLGNIIASDTIVPDSNAVGNWLWRQGDAQTSTAWWINFGSYVTFALSGGNGTAVSLTGFTGFGALGGGNITAETGGSAGYGLALNTSAPALTSSGLDVAVGSTGRVSGGSTAPTGGGDVSIHVGGALNAIPATETGVGGGTNAIQQRAALYGTISDIRGDILVSAGSVGSVVQQSMANNFDPRPVQPGANPGATSAGGPVLVIGDSIAAITARGNLALTGAADPTRLPQQEIATGISDLTGTAPSRLKSGSLRDSWFSLWQPGSSISLFSAGGDLVPIIQPTNGNYQNGNAITADFRYVYPPILSVVSASGNIYNTKIVTGVVGLETAPSQIGNIDFLAAGSIYGRPGNPIDISGADPTMLPNPSNPAYRIFLPTQPAGTPVTNVSPNGHAIGTDFLILSPSLPLFAFGADTASPTTHLGDKTPALFYAASGDIVGLQVGELINFPSIANETPSQWLIGGKSTRIVAGRDVVSSGRTPALQINGVSDTSAGLQAPDLTGQSGPSASALGTGNLIVTANTSDVSEVTAGRDIIYLNTQVAGPGELLVQAGRNLYQADQGVIESIGLVDRTAALASGGAGLTIIAGTGAAGPDYAAFADLYASSANLADPTAALQTQPGKVPVTYQNQLLSFLQANYGYNGSSTDALAFFATLTPVQQGAFVLPIYYGELNQAGLNYNDPSSRFYKTYLRGNLAIASLLPSYATTGYAGGITLFNTAIPNQTINGGAITGTGVRASGIRTDFGGDVQMLIPGGGLTLGVEAGTAPPASSGVVTQGNGNIDIYTQGSVLLGQSRILTTFGGSILIWSRQGDINAGRGSKSTVIATPIGIVYDNYGDVTLSPTVPSAGAGIGSLAPIPSVPPGDVNLIAPQGTIDAGEAGIRSSGNANLAALAVVNAANIQVKGTTTGAPVVAVPNLGALAAASAVAGSQAQAATNTSATNQRKPSDSIITVEVIGFGS